MVANGYHSCGLQADGTVTCWGGYEQSGVPPGKFMSLSAADDYTCGVRELHALLVRHKLPERSYHALRHYFLTALVRGGANLEAVRELAGHSKLHTTQRYVHATGADLRDAIGRLPGNWWETKKTPAAKFATGVSFSPTRSGRADSNCRPHGPEPCALPNCATPRVGSPRSPAFFRGWAVGAAGE